MKLLSAALSLGLVLAISFAMPVNAQSGPNLSPPDLRGTFPDVPEPPVPVDKDGNPIPVQPPTAEQIEAERIAQAQRTERLRLEEERIAAENAQRAEEERRAAELLAEQKQFHDRVMWAIYIGIGLLAIFVGSRLFKSNE